MKLNTTIVLLVILFTSCYLTAQTKQDYLLKSKHQRTAAWILLGGGVVAASAGSLIELEGLTLIFTRDAPSKISSGAVLMLFGTAAVITSIPLFIAASKNRRRSISVSFTNQPLQGLVKNMVRDKYVPSVSLQFKL